MLYAASSPWVKTFERKQLGLIKILPLALGMVLAVVLTNASLAHSTIQFYQVARVLVSPCTALIEFAIMRKPITLSAALALIPVCTGVAIVSYFDTSKASASRSTSGTSPLGMCFAVVSVVASSAYTVLIKKYHETADCESAQLLLNQAPVSVLLMLYIIPFSDDVTVWGAVSLSTWMIILLVRIKMVCCTTALTRTGRAAS